MERDIDAILSRIASSLYGATLDADTLLLATQEMGFYEDIAELNKNNIEVLKVLFHELEEAVSHDLP